MAKAKQVVIRKYGNRRLYDTSTSRYINLEELSDLVRNGNDIKVVDAKTGEDLTRLTLMQIIAEDAKGERAPLPLELLRQLIVASNHAGREFVMWYLKSAMDAYQKVEGAFHSPASPFSPLQMMKNLVTPARNVGDGAELQELKARLAELEMKQQRTGRKTARKKPPRRKKAGTGR